MLTRFRFLLILIVFLFFWSLPAAVMHFTGSGHAIITTQGFFDLSLMRNTISIAVVAVLVSLLIGLPTAYYFAYGTFRCQNVLLVMLLLPLAIPPYISAIGWLNLTNYAIQGETFPSFLIAGLIFGLSFFPVITFLSIMGFLQIEKRLEEAARLIHKDSTVFLRISIPLAKPFILAGAILVFLFVVLDYGVADFFMIRTYSIEIFTQFSLHNLRVAVNATYPLLALTLALAIIESLLVKHSTYMPKPADSGEGHQKKSRFAPVLIAGAIVVSAGIPIFALLKMAGSLTNYASAIRSSALPFWNTMLFGILTASGIVGFGFIWAHAIDAVKRGKTFLRSLSNMNLAIPGGLIAISLIMIWNHPITNWVYQTMLIIILCNFARFSPIAFKVIIAPFTTMSPHLKDMTRMVPGNYFLKMIRIFAPLARNGLIFGFIIAFLFSIRELESTLLILPPGKETIPIRIFSLIHYGAHEQVAVLSLGLIVLGFTVSLLALSLAKKQVRGRQ